MTNFREFFMQKLLVLLRPSDIDLSPKDFVSTYASYMESIAIVGKSADGYANYQSRTAPIQDENTEFFEEIVSLTDALDIHTAVGMDMYTDGWFARDPKYQTKTEKGKAMAHQICPNREEYWEYGAEIVKEIGSYPVQEVLLFGTGYIRDQFCFCERCVNEFAPMVNQEPNRLSYGYIIENPDYHRKWHEWRRSKVMTGIRQLQEAARDIDEQVGRPKPLKLSVEVLLDPETGFTEGAKDEYGYDYDAIRDTTGSLLINLYPWSPLLPPPGSKEHSDLVESLYFVNEFKRRGGDVALLRWGVTTIDQLQELKALGKEVGINKFVTTFSYPSDYSVRRESAIGNY